MSLSNKPLLLSPTLESPSPVADAITTTSASPVSGTAQNCTPSTNGLNCLRLNFPPSPPFLPAPDLHISPTGTGPSSPTHPQTEPSSSSSPPQRQNSLRQPALRAISSSLSLREHSLRELSLREQSLRHQSLRISESSQEPSTSASGERHTRHHSLSSAADQKKTIASFIRRKAGSLDSSSSTSTARYSLHVHSGTHDLSSIAGTGRYSGEWSRRSSEFLSGSLRGKDPDARVVYINNPEKTNERFEYRGNKVRTSKYTLLSFLPKNLFEQFHRIAYIYFLVILCLNQIPQLAVFGRYASLVPLLFVLVVTAIKDGYEDWRRHRSDGKENNRSALVFCEGQFVPKPWKRVMVGELVKVNVNETIPCDLVLLQTSDPSGLAYVQTINLDGESNLKTRYAHLETSERLEVAEKLGEKRPINGRIICEKPNRNIYGFKAYAEFEGKQLPLTPTNIILRGCELKNTSWIVGVAVYAGQETKVMLNSAGAQSKRSLLEYNMNRETLWLSLFLFIACFVSGLGMGLWLRSHKGELNVLPYYGGTGESYYDYYGVYKEAIFAFLSSLISFQVMIPISLYISMELVRLGQSYFMIRDQEMYHKESNTRLQCRDLSINEDLGQIKYVFSDKTGTLTENKMEFRSASIFGENYRSPEHANDVEGQDGQHINEGLGSPVCRPKTMVQVDPSLVKIINDPTSNAEREAVCNYMLTLAACNTVVPTKVNMTNSGKLKMEIALGNDNESCTLEYQAESPDEQALVSAAASYGFTLLSRTTNYILINVLGEVQRYEVLGMHEFDSTRKCMSVVLKCPDGSVKVLVKGADSAVLKKVPDDRESVVLFNTRMHLSQYSEEGLRTLVVAYKDLSAADVNNWSEKYTKASASLNDRAELLQEASEIIEKDLTLLGATGIEDKLQGGVPEAIATLREAGIKIWVLTGDKQETAISIGFSCALLTNDMKQIIINESEKEGCRQAISLAKQAYVSSSEKKQTHPTTGESFDAANVSIEMNSASEAPKEESQATEIDEGSIGSISMHREWSHSHGTQTLALIIDGNSLVHALEEDLEQELFDLAKACQVVVCCRVAPLQKAGIVSLVKRKSKEMTLAIGDGANDVSMIQMADVGVGISGQEGRQAVLASDFALPQFRFLKRLLLVHGRLNYRRLGYMVLYNFYRNAVLVMLLFWYMLYTAYSTSPAITQWSLVLYSIIYTSVPTIVVAVMDRDLEPETLVKYPAIYKGGQKNVSYNRKLFWLTMLDTLWQSLVLYYVPYLTYRDSSVDIWSIGSVWTISLVVIVNLHLAMDVEHFTWITHAVIWGSIVATYICIIVLDVLVDDGNAQPHYWVIFHVAATAYYWLDIALIVILGLLPRFIVKVAKQRFFPSYAQIIREKEVLQSMSNEV